MALGPLPAWIPLSPSSSAISPCPHALLESSVTTASPAFEVTQSARESLCICQQAVPLG